MKDIKEVWHHRELLYFFTWRDFKVRYKQTVVGILWVIFQPLITMIVFSIFFGKLASIPSDNIPYPIFVFTGLLFWQFFSSTVAEVSNVLTANQAIITKIYFPRLALPISTIFTRLVDFAIATLILIALMVYYHFMPSIIGFLLFPVLVATVATTTLGLGLILSAINVKYRDVRFVLPFFIQLLLFITPVIYPTTILGSYSWILMFNPLTGIIETARSTLLNTGPINITALLISIVMSVVLLVAGTLYFKKAERNFADII